MLENLKTIFLAFNSSKNQQKNVLISALASKKLRHFIKLINVYLSGQNPDRQNNKSPRAELDNVFHSFLKELKQEKNCF